MPRHELARLKLMRQPMRSRVAQIVQPCEKSGLEQTNSLPPCFILGAETDSWCLADSLTLAQSLSAVASPYELHVMEGMPHGFMQMSMLDGCRAAMGLTCEFLARNV
jgi:acetyl esterase/lipase